MPTTFHLVKTMIFPIGMYGYDSWIIKKAEHQSIDAFELWCWRRFSRAPWTARRSKQSILQEIKAEYSLEGLIFKLKLQYFGHLMGRTDSLEKTLILGKIEGRWRREWQMRWIASSTQWTWVWVSSRELVMNKEAWHAAVHGVAKNRTRLSDWTELNGLVVKNPPDKAEDRGLIPGSGRSAGEGMATHSRILA